MISLSRGQKWLAALVVLGIALIYYASHPLLLCRQLIIRNDDTLYIRLHLDDQPYAWLTENNYSFRYAEVLLKGKLGLAEKPPGWLNEVIPLRGQYYSVFSVGSVLTMVPFALLHRWLTVSPAGIAIALIGALGAFLFFRIALARSRSFRDAIALTLFATLGTWLWTNTVMGGAWQLALAFAMIGELAATYYSFIRPRPFLAGLFFAFAFGNRTEVILTAPVFAYGLLCNCHRTETGEPCHPERSERPRDFQLRWRVLIWFCVIPLFLGIATLLYNGARFGSPFDFGLARLPGVLDEPWYQHGIFSVYAIPDNAWQMLFQPWDHMARPPYFLPDGFGGSIFLNAPFLICILLPSTRERGIRIAAWSAIVLLTAVFWCHGNTGGWQFSYRSAIVMLPWLFMLLIEATHGGIRRWQWALITVSIAINAYATFLFLWTNWIQP